METRVLAPTEAAIAEAARIIRGGGLVAFPTETVYGLGADALNGNAVQKIFEAKGRPGDNPLIVHVATPEAAQPLCYIDERAQTLMRAFWPGPLTLLLPKKLVIPSQTNAGLPSVAVRMPNHPVALALLRACGVPVAAPSANVSGRPSPTTAGHVLQDMDGRIPLILDGGPCAVGLESTVLDMTAETPVIVRPGGVTREMLLAVLPRVDVAASVLRPLAEGEKAVSPGMMYRHYAPKGALTLVMGKPDDVRATCLKLYREAMESQEKACILTHSEHALWYEGCDTLSIGSLAQPETVARELFSALRAMDDRQVRVILCEAVDTDGIGLAIMNRLYRAAAFCVLEV
ncbi:MAG: threonylcarbamoyl-AMP synthase [Eubacteriales bacterium]|nr:threonylcarbamoyl-AMP synthase [Eubacteriales bacterium]